MDKLWYLEEMASPQCRLCHAMVESHEHLFFQCSYSTTVWDAVNRKAGLTWPNHSWNALLQWAALHLKTNSSDLYLVARVILASVVYFIWLERNNRIFNQIHKPAFALASDITQLIRLHLASLQLSSPLSICTKTRWGINEDPPPR